MDEILENSKDYEKELARIYDRFNHHFWNDELPDVIITFAPTKRAYGHMTTKPVWVSRNGDETEKKYELNISAYTINRSPEEICATLLHEQCHLYDLINGIKDCSNHNRYHNKKFQKTAQAHGLICTFADNIIGYSNTVLNEEAKKYVKKLNVKQFEFKREEEAKQSHTLVKYICPVCKETSAWVTKKQNLVCGKCGVPLVRAPKCKKKADK